MAQNVAAIDELLEAGKSAKTRRDDAAKELAAVVKALDGMAGVGWLDEAQRRQLGRLRPTRKRRARRTAPTA